MSDRGMMFVMSVIVLLGSLGCAGWLIVSGQASSVDGLFLLLTCGLIALAFALYLVFLISTALEELQPPPPAKKGAPVKADAGA